MFGAAAKSIAYRRSCIYTAGITGMAIVNIVGVAAGISIGNYQVIVKVYIVLTGGQVVINIVACSKINGGGWLQGYLINIGPPASAAVIQADGVAACV